MAEGIPSVLLKIAAEKRNEVADLWSTGKALEYKRKAVVTAYNFIDVISKKRRVGLNPIFEIKMASPSAGEIRPGADPVEIAKLYEKCGASAISVLTDEKFFKGHLDYLRRVRKAVKLPLLRKDFTIDEAQIYEARVYDADAVLLITALLDVKQLRDYRHIAEVLGMAALVEVHNEGELEKAIKSGANLLGINNRDLHKMKTDINTTLTLLQKIPENYNVPIVTESGIHSYEDVRTLAKPGIKAMLVGESIMSLRNNPTLGDMERKMYELQGISKG